MATDREGIFTHDGNMDLGLKLIYLKRYDFLSVPNVEVLVEVIKELCG